MHFKPIATFAEDDEDSQCPRRLDCALRRRNPCPSGSRDCGHCLPHYREDNDRKCMLTGHQRQDGNRKAAGPDDAFGLIHSLLTQWEKFTPVAAADREMNKTVSELPLVPSYTRGNSNSLSNSGPPQSTEKPATTTRTMTESHSRPDRGRKQSSRLLNDVVSLSLVIICIVTGLFGLVVAGLCWYRLQKEVRRAQKVAYEGNKQPLPQPIDWKIVEKLQKHHYQHQKKVIQAMEESKSKAQVKQMSADSETDNENGEYTVYECPGLAPKLWAQVSSQELMAMDNVFMTWPDRLGINLQILPIHLQQVTGEMEIHNPLFDNSIFQGYPSSKED
ncbi:neural proliferation differentiation and control protein 1-like [Cetorhinus maximus]